MAINERFELEEMSKISQRIAKHIDDKENFEIGESNSLKRKLLFDYLNEIELVCQFHDDKVLTTTQLYELMGYVIMELVKVRPILELIDNERTKKDGYPDYMDNFQKTYPILLKHQTKKWKKETLENIMTLHKD